MTWTTFWSLVVCGLSYIWLANVELKSFLGALCFAVVFFSTKAIGWVEVYDHNH